MSAVNEDDKRKQIRTLFFPLGNPSPPESNEWFNVLLVIAFLVTAGFVLSSCWTLVYSEDQSNEATGNAVITFWGAIIVGGGVIRGLIWLDEEVLETSKKQEKYQAKAEKRSNMLKRWGLTEEDFQNKPSISTIDKWLNEDFQVVTQRALDKLALRRSDLVRDPMIIYGPLFWTTYGISDEEITSIKITDGTLRFSCYQLVVVCLSKDRIATYSANFNFLRNVFVGEKSVEYLYRDIVSVSTEEKSTNYNLPNGRTLRRAQIFRLAVPSGDNIEVVVSSPEIKDLLGGVPKLTNHDQSVRVIREMLRSKKG